MKTQLYNDIKEELALAEAPQITEADSVAIVCSIFIPRGNIERVKHTLEWYNNIAMHAGHDFNLYLMNDGSEEPIDSIIPYMVPKGFCKAIYFYKSELREGKAKQINKLIKLSKSTFIGVVDNDVLLPKTWLLGCMQVCSFEHLSVCGVIVQDELLSGISYKFKDIPYCEPEKLGGACLVWNRSKLGERGFFNENYGVYGHEDGEFVVRMCGEVGRVAAIVKRGYHFEDADVEYTNWKHSEVVKTGQQFEADINKIKTQYTKNQKMRLINS